jgi:DNA-directed RNA polymerase subunit H (RpoH/RPB5)
MDPLSDADLLRVKRESLKILRDRGFDIPEREMPIMDEDITIQQFKGIYLEAKDDIYHPLYNFISRKIPFRTFMSNIYSRPKSNCLVFFAEPEEKTDKKVSNEQVADFCRLVIETRVEEAILISNVTASNAISSLCGEGSKGLNKVYIQFFTDDELMYNPLEHVFVPKHRIISEREVKEIKDTDKINLSQLPKISKFDPICKRLGADENDVIEIVRRVLISHSLIDEELSYRVVFTPRIEKARK